jgi:hypothetical protein
MSELIKGKRYIILNLPSGNVTGEYAGGSNETAYFKNIINSLDYIESGYYEFKGCYPFIGVDYEEAESCDI